MVGMNLTQGRMQEFTAALEKANGSCGNGNLRRQLGWEQEFYWKVQERLIADGRVVAGRGRGGSVRLSQAANSHREYKHRSSRVSEPCGGRPSN
jgi:type I restriction enzyme M protein